jgi:hypothetical protein
MKYIALLIGMIGLISCSTKEPENNSDVSPFAAGGKYEQELSKELETFQKEEEAIRKANEDKLTDIEFEEKDFDFGKIRVESQNEHFFVIKNTGNKPLIIENVQASCGCTTPIKPERPIPPGQKDSIKVRFSPFQGMSGLIEKTVTVKTNTFIPVNQLFIRATVE